MNGAATEASIGSRATLATEKILMILSWLDAALVGEVVHPRLVGAAEEIGGCARLDLARKRRTRREREAQGSGRCAPV
jgi:hypothetical protein